MGAGEFEAGVNDIAGEDPLAPLDAARDVQHPAALLFDGATRTYPLDAQGRYLGIHPVDQRVALALIITLGSVGSVPALGNGLRLLTKITKRTPAEAQNAIALALAPMVAAKDITVRKVEIETRGAPTGAILAAVSYTNLRLPKSTIRTLTV